MDEPEIWIECESDEFPGLYAASNFGNVKNLTTGKILKACISNNGYYLVNFWKYPNYHKLYLLSRIIAHTWLPNPDNKPDVDHINRNKLDNRVSNLRWATRSENIRNTTRSIAAKERQLILQEYGAIWRMAEEERADEEKRRRYELLLKEHETQRKKAEEEKRNKAEEEKRKKAERKKNESSFHKKNNKNIKILALINNMSMTHAELQKKYIEKKKQEMGEEAYNKMMREKKAIYRTRLKDQDSPKVIKVENSLDSLNKLRTTFADMTSSKNNEKLRPTTVENYVQKMNRLCILITGKGYSGCLKFLKDSDAVVEELMKSNLKSKKDYLSPVVKLLREEGEDELVQEYLKHMGSFKEDEDRLRKQNVSTQKERDNFISLNEVQKRIRAFKPRDDTELMYLVIVSMYFMGDDDSLVPRNNLSDFKLVSSVKKIRDINPDFNYLVMRGDEPIGVVMNRYKSQATYGRQKFSISEFQRDVLIEYLSRFDKKNGDFLFSKGGYAYSYQQFSDLIDAATRLILGKPINIDLIRKIIITAYWDEGLHSIAQDEKFARRFLHSVKQSREYAKVDLAEN